MIIKNTIMVKGRGRLVCRIYDTGDNNYLDRYTIAFKGYRIAGYGVVYPYIGCSEYPFTAVGYHGDTRELLTGKHLGKRVSFESLPSDVQKFILQSI